MSLFSKLFSKKTNKVTSCSTVIAAAGSSNRMDGIDKIFINILGVPVLAHTLLAFQNCEYISEIIIVARTDCVERINDICQQFDISKATQIVFGGDSRLISVLNGVLAVSNDADIIAIHDGARPCIDPDIIERAIQAAIKYNAAAPAVPVTSTLKRVYNDSIIETVDRDNIFEIQTPQVFQADLIKAALTNAINKSVEVTDDSKAVELLGATVYITEGSNNNIKLTTAEDIVIAEAILTARKPKLETGMVSN